MVIRVYALRSAQGTACAETVLREEEFTPERRAEVEATACRPSPWSSADDLPVPGTWMDVSDNDALVDRATWTGMTDSDGEPCRFLNHYRCEDCVDPETGAFVEWEDQWSCQCDDECPSCGNDFSPYKSEDVEE